jgi:hypothetical protein
MVMGKDEALVDDADDMDKGSRPRELEGPTRSHVDYRMVPLTHKAFHNVAKYRCPNDFWLR